MIAPAPSSGARLRRSDGPAARQRAISIPTTSRQSVITTAEPAANRISPRRSSCETSSGFSGHGPSQSASTSDSLTSIPGTGASGTRT